MAFRSAIGGKGAVVEIWYRARITIGQTCLRISEQEQKNANSSSSYGLWKIPKSGMGIPNSGMRAADARVGNRNLLIIPET